ncbi:MAG: DUF368 domain-containing protein [Pseudohongiellaceae bacterium]
MAEPATGTRKPHWLVFIKGMAMGVADSVPGVSGGTIAVVTHIYDELIFSLRAINLTALRLLFNSGVKSAWSYINGNFLLVLLAGIVLALWLSANTVLYLLAHFFEPLMAFFIGLVLASSWTLRVRIDSFNVKRLAALMLGVLLTLAISSLTPRTGDVSAVYLFFCGMIAICAMILPGLSGAFLLLILGVYNNVMEALIAFDLPVIAVFVSGCAIGLLGFSRLLGWALYRHPQVSYAGLTGMLLGSVYVLWPWQQPLAWYTDSGGERHVLQSGNVLPLNYEDLTGTDPQILLVLTAVVAGAALILIMERLFAARQP